MTQLAYQWCILVYSILRLLVIKGSRLRGLQKGKPAIRFVLCWIIVTESCCLKFLEGSSTRRLQIDYQLIKTQYNSFVLVPYRQCNAKPSEHAKLKPLKRFHSNRRLNFLFNSIEKRILWCFFIKERSQTENPRK